MKGNNYKAANYTVEIEVPMSADKVFNHIVDLSKWWPEEFEGERIKLNSEFKLSTGDDHYSKNKVTEFVPNKKLAWTTTDSIRKTDNFDWSGTKFIFELTPEANNTRIRFTYDGVVLEHESDRLAQMCDTTVKDMLYSFLTKNKQE